MNVTTSLASASAAELARSGGAARIARADKPALNPSSVANPTTPAALGAELQRTPVAADPAAILAPELTAAAPAAVEPGAIGSGPTLNDLLDLVNHWGQAGSNWDLDGDGTVNISDLMSAINAMYAAAGQPVGENANPVSANTPTDADVNQGLALNKPASMAASGPARIEASAVRVPERDKPIARPGEPKPERTHPGRTPMEKPLAAGTQLDKPLFSRPDMEKPLHERPSADAIRDRQPTNEQARLQPKLVADSLIDRLAAAGFATQPPVNIHDLVSQLQLSDKDSRDVIGRIQSRYPSGLGVNMIG